MIREIQRQLTLFTANLNMDNVSKENKIARKTSIANRAQNIFKLGSYWSTSAVMTIYGSCSLYTHIEILLMRHNVFISNKSALIELDT